MKRPEDKAMLREKKLFGKRMEEARKSLGLSQLALSRKVGCHYISIWGYETGSRSPNIIFLKRIAEALDVSCDMLLGRSSGAKKKKDPKRDVFLQRYDSLPKRDRETVMALTTYLYNQR